MHMRMCMRHRMDVRMCLRMGVGELAGVLALLPIIRSVDHDLRMPLLAGGGAATHGPAAREAAATGCLVAGAVTCAAATSNTRNSQTTVSNTSNTSNMGEQPGPF